MTTASLQFIGVGSPIVDILATIPESFLSNVSGGKGGMELVTASEMERLLGLLTNQVSRHPGGSAGNTAFALARMGLTTAFLGKIGNDEFGTYYRESFTARGGHPSRFKVAEIANGRCLSLITPDAERTMRTDLGAAVLLAPDEIVPADFAGCRHAHIEGYLLFNPDLMNAVLHQAKAAGCTISLDLASYEVVNASIDRLPEILKNYVDLIFANEEEAAAYFNDNAAPDEHARRFAEICNIGVVKVGKQGSWIAHSGECFHMDAIQGIQAVDTTGAGDLWASGFLYGWLRGKSLAESAHNGSVMGAAVVRNIGAKIEEDQWSEILQQLN